jgi:chlorite dismutase
MRFDEVSAVYALFGSFYLGERIAPEKVPDLMLARLG